MVQKGAVQPLAHISLGIRSVNAVDAYVEYLHKMFWPVNLAIPYVHPGYGSFSRFCVSAALLLTAVVVAIVLRGKYPFLAVGWFWYLGMLVPVIGLVQVGMQSMADRYTYLPLIGVFLLLTWAAREVMGRLRLPNAAVGSIALLVLAGCTARTVDQLRYWQHSETLFRHTIAVNRNNEIAWYNLGHYYSSQERLAEAIDGYRHAIQIKPDYDDALHNLGVVLAKKGDLDAAIGPIREAIRLRPDKADAYFNLANVLALQHKLDEAIPLYQQALEFKADYPEAHQNLGNLQMALGEVTAARDSFREAIRLRPAYARAHHGLGRALEALRQAHPRIRRDAPRRLRGPPGTRRRARSARGDTGWSRSRASAIRRRRAASRATARPARAASARADRAGWRSRPRRDAAGRGPS